MSAFERNGATEKYIEYAHSPENAWTLVERPIFDFLLEGEIKRIPKYRHGFPLDYSALDLGTGTGRVIQMLIEQGVNPQSVLGVDSNNELLNDKHFPDGANKLSGDIANIKKVIDSEFPDTKHVFNLITSNMVFNQLNYGDYVKCLKQTSELMLSQGYLIVVVPHPLVTMFDSIDKYHNPGVLEIMTPWGMLQTHQIKNIQDYLRGLMEAEFDVTGSGTTGLDIIPNDRFCIEDSYVWYYIKKFQKTGEKPVIPKHFRLWFAAKKESYRV